MNNTMLKLVKRRVSGVISLLAILMVMGGVNAASNVEMDLTQSPEVSGTAEGKVKMPKQQKRMALNYVNQPPMIPHSVDGYQVSKILTAACNATGLNTISPRVHPGSAQVTFMTVMAKSPAKYRRAATSAYSVMCHKPTRHRLLVIASSQHLALVSNRDE